MTIAVQAMMFGQRQVGFCMRCGRTLTDPRSVSAHIGPVCAGKRQDGDGARAAGEDAYIPAPLTDGIILRRRADGGVETNITRRVVYHSPTGYNFGYGGSGPADLALNIAEAMLLDMGYTGELMQCWRGACFEKAFELHQDIKWEFISVVPSEGTTISYQAVRDWIAARL